MDQEKPTYVKKEEAEIGAEEEAREKRIIRNGFSEAAAKPGQRRRRSRGGDKARANGVWLPSRDYTNSDEAWKRR